MRPPEHRVARELGERVLGESLDHALAEAGRQPVCRQPLGEVALDDRARRVHARARLGSKLDVRTITRDPDDVFDREAEPVEPQALWSTPPVQPGELIFLSEADVGRLEPSDSEIL